jgi:putative ATP-binding cassette transporter
MNTEQVSFSRLNWARFVRGVRKLATSEVGAKAKMLFALLIALLLAINGLNVVSSYVGRDFMTAIESRSMAGFIWLGILYIAVFAASTVAAVFFRFTEESLSLLWRKWLTQRLVSRYLQHPTYYRLNYFMMANGQVANPDQRIAEDVRVFTVTTLSFGLMFLNATLTVVAFSGVMWSISPLLFGVAVLYATVGSLLTIFLGRRLVRLNYDQLDKEANFRADLIHVRENAESVALLRREGRLRARLLRHLEELTGNFHRIIAVNRNLGFFTTGYNYLIQIIPGLIVAPLFIRGQVEFGVITQSAMAFAHLLGAFSLIVTQFQSISSFTAVISRLGSLMEGLDRARLSPVSEIEVSEDNGRIIYQRLTLRSPRDGRTLINDLSITIPRQVRLLIVGPSVSAKIALFRATAGIWRAGEGRIVRPGVEDIFFLTERPYVPPGTLREVLLRTGQERVIPEGRILATLRLLDLEQVLARADGLDTEKDWDDILSLGEQQLLAFARLLLAAPRFAFLDRPGTTLSLGQLDQILPLLFENSIAYLTLGNGDDRLEHYDAILELADDGGWKWRSIREGQRIREGILSTCRAESLAR